MSWNWPDVNSAAAGIFSGCSGVFYTPVYHHQVRHACLCLVQSSLQVCAVSQCKSGRQSGIRLLMKSSQGSP